MRTKEIPSLAKLMEVVGTIRNPYLDKAQAAGRKLVGVVYQEIPEEILTAAGCVPVLLRGTGADGMEFAEAYFRQLTCNYVRYTFEQIIDGAWDYLDGVVLFNACDHARRIWDNWKLLPSAEKCYHFMYVPKKSSDLSREFYAREVDKLVEATEKRFGVRITAEKLAAAIALHNETRRLQRAVYDLQKGDEVYLTGTELVAVMLAALCMPREDYNALVASMLSELKAAGETMKPDVRLLYCGGMVDNLDFFRNIERRSSAGGKLVQIVADKTGYGMCAAREACPEGGDPLKAIVDYYFDIKPTAPRRHATAPARMKMYTDLVAEYKADGIVSARITMCDLWAYEQFMIRDYLRNTTKTPFLELEVDYMPESFGQIATRVQAFVESILAARK